MKLLLVAALVLALGVISLASDDDKLLIKYDRFKDKTVVASALSHIKQLEQTELRNHELVVINENTPFFHFDVLSYFEFDGQRKPATIPAVVLGFKTISRNGQFDSDPELYAIADGERFQLGRLMRNKEIFRLLDVIQVHETLVLRVPMSTCSKIAKSKTVEMRLGSYEFQLQKENLEALGKLVDYALAANPSATP